MFLNCPSHLTPKQEAFCLAYVDTGNASEAYRRSYDAQAMKPETVNRKAFDLLRIGKIAARVSELRSIVVTKATRKISIDKQWVLARLVEIVHAGQASTTRHDEDGAPIGDGKANLMAAIRALELIGRELGMFNTRREEQPMPGSDIPRHERVEMLRAIRAELERRKVAGQNAPKNETEAAGGEPPSPWRYRIP